MEDYKVKKKIVFEDICNGNCMAVIKESLTKLIGVTKVKIDENGRYAIIDADLEVGDNAIKYVVSNLGCKVKGIEGL